MSKPSEYKRWYDNNKITSRCVELLEQLSDRDQRKTATFLMNEIISQPHFSQMLPKDIFNHTNSEKRRNRWYDEEEAIRIFMELLKICPEAEQKTVATKAIIYMEGLKEYQE